MDIEYLAIMLGAVLPIYPALFGIYQRIGRYDAACRELDTHLSEHGRHVTEAVHDHRTRNRPDN